MTGRVLVVGDVIDDVLVRPSRPVRDDTDTPSRIERLPGGSAANTACWLAAAGVPATLVATVGAADLDRCAGELARHGVAPALVAAEGATTGTIVVLSRGERRTMLTDRGANLLTGPDPVLPLLDAAAHLHLTGHVLTGRDRDAGWRELLRAAASAGVRRSVAPGSVGLLDAYGAGRFRRVVAGVELLVASEDEAALLTGERDPVRAADALAGEHELVAVTLGRQGALLRSAGGVLHVPTAPATLVDVTGAGDAWVAGLLAALLRGAGIEEAGTAAALLAARAVGQVGARP